MRSGGDSEGAPPLGAAPSADACCQAGVEQPHGSEHVRPCIGQWIEHRDAYVDLRSVVKHNLGPLLRKEVGEVHIADVRFHQPRGRVHLLAPSAREIVHHHHVVAVAHQRIDQVRPDEAGSAGDQRPHPRAGAVFARGACRCVNMKTTKPMTTTLP